MYKFVNAKTAETYISTFSVKTDLLSVPCLTVIDMTMIDVILLTYLFTSYVLAQVPRTINQEYRFRLNEHTSYQWTPRLSSSEFMRLLANITALRIRGTYSPEGDLTALFNTTTTTDNNNN